MANSWEQDLLNQKATGSVQSPYKTVRGMSFENLLLTLQNLNQEGELPGGKVYFMLRGGIGYINFQTKELESISIQLRECYWEQAKSKLGFLD